MKVRIETDNREREFFVEIEAPDVHEFGIAREFVADTLHFLIKNVWVSLANRGEPR